MKLSEAEYYDRSPSTCVPFWYHLRYAYAFSLFQAKQYTVLLSKGLNGALPNYRYRKGPLIGKGHN